MPIETPESLVQFFLVAFPAIFTIVNPLVVVGPFLSMTASDSPDKKRSTAQRACLVGAIVLVVCATAGSFLFDLFSIKLPALKVAGGILLFAVAVDMVNARPSREKSTEEERAEGENKDDIAIFPLAIPLLCGPGSMASVFILEGKAKTLVHHGIIYLSIVVTMLLSYLVLSNAKHLARMMGATGINVLGRLMGLVLAAIAVQFVLTGLLETFPAWNPNWHPPTASWGG